jgi:hypothetical protein
MHGTLRHRDIAVATARHCLECPAPVKGKVERCESCRKARNKKSSLEALKRYWKTPKGRAKKAEVWKKYYAKNKDKNRRYCANYRARNRVEGKITSGDNGRCIYLAKPIQHIRDWRRMAQAAT